MGGENSDGSLRVYLWLAAMMFGYARCQPQFNDFVNSGLPRLYQD